MPGGPDGRRPCGRETGKAAGVIALPDPLVVDDGLVVVADDPAQLSPELRCGTLLGRLHEDYLASRPAGSSAGHRPPARSQPSANSRSRTAAPATGCP